MASEVRVMKEVRRGEEGEVTRRKMRTNKSGHGRECKAINWKKMRTH